MRHFYSPIPYYNGEVLKYQGICTPENEAWFVEDHPGTVIKDEYLGDRIKASDHSPFYGF